MTNESYRLVFLCSWLTAISVLSSTTAGDVRWRNGTAPIPRRQSGQIFAAIEEITRGGGARHLVVQFEEPITDKDKAALSAAGVRLLDFLGDNAFFAAVEPGRLNAVGLAAVPGFSRVAVVDPGWKLHPSLAIGEIPHWAIQAPEKTDEEAVGIRSEPPRPADPIVAVLVKFHPDVPLATEAVDICGQYGANVKSSLAIVNTLVIELPQSKLMMLVAEDAVEWMEPPLPALQEINAENRAQTGANTVQAPPYSLSGAGVNVMVYDAGRVRTTHVDFQGRAFIGSGEAACSTLSNHSTHVAGTIGGAGVQTANNKGMAPAVNIISYGFQQSASGTTCPSLSAGFLYTDPGDMNHDYNAAINVDGAHISNNSIGTNTAPNGFPCAWEGDYGVTDTLIDSIVRGGLGTPFRVIWANGNERQVSTCGTTYHTTAPPACAKNHITVGALNANDDSLTSFTSWGPADDGRMKPDISAPGCQVGGDAGVTSCSSSSDTAYASLCGTSMASPTVCGLAALIMQDYRAHFGMAAPFMRNSTLKILLAHTAVDRGNVGPDNQFGYGSVRVQPAIDFMRSNNYGNFIENQVSQGGSYNTLVVVNPGDPVMKVSLAWDDVPGTPNVSPALVNDLDLVVFDPNNVQRFPWTLGGLANPGAPAVQTQANHVDNIEQVLVNAPTPGVYWVEVQGTNVPQGPQPFSVCASPLLVNCSRQGLMMLDRADYGCGSTATIRVVDCDLNTDDNVVETFNVTIDSSTEPTGETVMLTETGAATAAFVGTIGFSTTDSVGVLHIADGDTATATYLDADDGLDGFNIVVTDNATVDCMPPVISNIQSSTTPTSATITFNTDEAARGTVRWGTSCAALGNTLSEGLATTAHSFVITPILANTTHYFAVDAEDAAGNASTDNNGGACHTFIFVEPILSLPFLDSFPNTTFDFLKWAAVSNATIDNQGISIPSPLYAARFNGDPAGNDSAVSWQIDLSAESAVRLSYSYQIRGNGETPDAGDDLIVEYLDATSSWIEMSRHLGSGADMTVFQPVTLLLPPAALHSGFRLRIRSIGTAGAFDDWFVDDVLLEQANSPEAANVSAFTAIDTPVTITLQGSDPNLDPLSYIILSLPTQTLRDPGANHVIVPGDLPYALTGGGNQIVYVPAGGFSGIENFTYKVNDGTYDSNIATVTTEIEPILTLPFLDMFPSTSFDPTKWDLVAGATIDGAGLNPPSPPNSAHFDGSPDGSDEIQTHRFNLAPLTAVRLSYAYEQRGGGESPDSGDDLFVEYLDASSLWQLLQQHLGSGPDMTVFQTVTVFLPPGALHAGFRLRFRNIATSGAFDDWFVDDVSLTVANAPTAVNGSVTTPANTFVNIALLASDPNMDPLTYVIQSLPADGTLIDLNNGQIITVPYALVGGGSGVRYAPSAGFNGINSFTFKVSDGTYESNIATVTITVGGPQPVHVFPLDSDPGWTTDAGPGGGSGPNGGGWAFGTPTNSDPPCGTGRVDPPGGFTGASVYGYNLAGCYTNNLSPTRWLTTSAINCEYLSGVELRYRRWLGVESASYDHANIQVSSDGVNWTTVWNHTATTAINDSAWSLQAHSLLGVADNQATVFLRWGMGTTDGSVTYQGWNIDDVEIWALAPSCPAISVNPASWPNATAGLAYSQAVTASGGTGPYTFDVTTGSLPVGLTLSSGGVLSGTPSGPGGTANFTITATDSNSCTGERAYALTVNCATITLSPTSLPATFVDRAYDKTLTAGGGSGPYSYAVTAGALPSGLTLSPGGVISGTCATGGTYNFTVTATDGVGCPGSRAYSIIVRVKAIEPI